MSVVAAMIGSMDFDHALFRADLDALPWASYGHAYGSAEDVPGCLRALAGDDDAAADEAQGELYGSILHQGSVYEASAQAVPFLARIAAADIRTADVLLLDAAEAGAAPAEAVEALVALGVDTLSDEHRDRLTELGERDLRVVRFGLSGTIEAADDRLRARIRTVVVGGVRTAVVSPG